MIAQVADSWGKAKAQHMARNQQREVESGSLQVVDALGQVFVGQLLDAFDLDQQAAIRWWRSPGGELPLAYRMSWNHRTLGSP